MSFSDRPSPGTWLLSARELDQVVATVLSKIRVDRTHDIPYVAGYSKDGMTIFIDHTMPEGFNYRGKFIKTDRYLILHETVERSLEDKPYFLDYLLSHQVALRTERDAVIADGVPWAEYNTFCMKYIKSIGSKPSYPNCPNSLDLEPYQQEDDRATLRKMRFTNVFSKTASALPSQAIH